MNEKVKEFLDAKKAAEKKAYEEEKKITLIDLGLVEKIYKETEGYDPEFPFSEYDNETDICKWYKEVPVTISDEEYEEIKKYSKRGGAGRKNNPIATMIKVIAILAYIGGFASGLIVMGDAVEIGAICWASGFVGGTSMLGFAEIIELLNDIKNK